MKKASTLEELVEKYLGKTPLIGKADSYDLYKHKNGISSAKSYYDAITSLYANSKQGLSSFGDNNRKINNKGLQNSGYSAYIDSLIKNNFNTKANALKNSYADSEAKARGAYASYLESYADKQDRVKRSVMTHLTDNDVTDVTTAVAYGMSAGLSKEDAEAVGKSAYEVTRKKLFNQILEEAVSLGLDKDGAKLLALKFGITETDADGIAEEVDEMLKYYRSISKDYLDFLEERAK